MYTPEFETLILAGIEEEEYQALLREIAEEESPFGPEYVAWVAELDAEIDIEEMAKYYSQE